MRDYLIINGKNLKDFNIYAFGNSRHRFPERVVETVSIPGRTGDLIIDKGKYTNIDVEYSVVLLGNGENVVDALRAFLLTLKGYVRIESTFEPDYYRLGRFVGATDPVAKEQAATLTITFDCKPWKYLKLGEKEIVGAISQSQEKTIDLYNPTKYPALPLIKVQTGLADANPYIKVVANEEYTYNDQLTLSKTTQSFTIDTEIRMAYRSGANYNSRVLRFPDDYAFYPGHFSVKHFNFTELIIQPRWRTL